MKEKIILIGGGGHCQSCIDVIELENKFEIVGFVDNDPSKENILNYPYLGADEQLSSLISKYKNCLITVGQIKNPHIRTKLFTNILALGGKFPVIISSRAHVSSHSKVGPGTIVMHDALVNAGATIGKNCIINTKSLVEHNAIIKDYCHLSTGAILNGDAILEEGSFMGSNSVSLQSITIPPKSIIPAGTFFKGDK